MSTEEISFEDDGILVSKGPGIKGHVHTTKPLIGSPKEEIPVAEPEANAEPEPSIIEPEAEHELKTNLKSSTQTVHEHALALQASYAAFRKTDKADKAKVKRQ